MPRFFSRFSAIFVNGSGGGTPPAPGSPTPRIHISSAPNVSVTQGGTALVEVTLVRQGGFTGAVDVSITSGLPTGVTASTTTLNPDETVALLTLTAASDAVTGAATLTVTATGTGVTNAIDTTALTVLAGSPDPTADDSISLSTTLTATLSQGGSGTIFCTVTRNGGWVGAVTVQVTAGLPSGVTASTLSLGVSDSAGPISLNATSGASLGTVTLTVTATGSGVSNATDTTDLTVNAGGTSPGAGDPVPLTAVRFHSGTASTYVGTGIPLLEGSLTAAQVASGYGALVDTNTNTEVPIRVTVPGGTHPDGSLRVLHIQPAAMTLTHGAPQAHYEFRPGQLRAASAPAFEDPSPYWDSGNYPDWLTLGHPGALLSTDPVYLCNTKVGGELLPAASNPSGTPWTNFEALLEDHFFALTATADYDTEGGGGAYSFQYEMGWIAFAQYCRTGNTQHFYDFTTRWTYYRHKYGKPNNFNTLYSHEWHEMGLLAYWLLGDTDATYHGGVLYGIQNKVEQAACANPFGTIGTIGDEPRPSGQNLRWMMTGRDAGLTVAGGVFYLTTPIADAIANVVGRLTGTKNSGEVLLSGYTEWSGTIDPSTIAWQPFASLGGAVMYRQTGTGDYEAVYNFQLSFILDGFRRLYERGFSDLNATLQAQVEDRLATLMNYLLTQVVDGSVTYGGKYMYEYGKISTAGDSALEAFFATFFYWYAAKLAPTDLTTANVFFRTANGIMQAVYHGDPYTSTAPNLPDFTDYSTKYKQANETFCFAIRASYYHAQAATAGCTP